MISNRYKITKVSIVFMLTIIISIQSLSTAVAQSVDVYRVPIRFTFDEMRLAPPENQLGFIYQDTTYLPLRFVVYSLNQAVDWDPVTSTVTIREPESHEQIDIDVYNINNQLLDTSESEQFVKPVLEPLPIEMHTRKVTYVVGGESIIPTADLEGFIINDRLFVPLRFVSQTIGYEVAWDPSTYSVALLSPAYIAKQAIVPVVIPTAPSSSGGSSSGPPSKASILTHAEAQLSSLKASCERTLNNILANFRATGNESSKFGYFLQGVAAVDECDEQFDDIMISLESSLTANGYTTTEVSIYRSEYAKLKEEMEDSILQ